MNIVVTGAGKGIGFETTVQLASDGHKVVAVSRNISVLSSLNNENIIPLEFDLLNTDMYADLVSFVKRELGGVDVVINNAGFLLKKEYYHFSVSEFQQIFNTNVMSPFFLIQAIKPLLRKNSHIVNIGSMGGITGSAKFPGMSLYSSSKAALAVLTECLATELKESEIFINCLALGAANTEMLRQAFPDFNSPVSASSMARYIAWFSLNGTQWFNGQVIPVALSTP